MRVIAAVVFLSLTSSSFAFAQLSPDQAKKAQAHYKAGLELMSAENWEKAAEEFKAAVSIDPLMAMAYYNLGQCRMSQKRYVEAVTAFQDCRSAFERLASASQAEREARERQRRDEVNELRDDLQRLRYLKQPSASLQIQMEERLRQLESIQYRDRAGDAMVPAGVYLALGSAYFRQGKLEDAEREYRQAIAQDKKLGAAHNNLAVIYLMTGRPEEAETAIKDAERNGFSVNPALKNDVKAAKEKARDSAQK
jgi:tetratricopeptide (TPR) repeat protein